MTVFNDEQNRILTDLHYHGLAGMDDGVSNIDEAISLLEEKKKQNIKQIIFTPKFNADTKDISSFLKERNKAASALIPYLQKEGFTCGLGAVVCMSEKLRNIDLKPLAFSGTKYILLEWPLGDYCLYGEEIVNQCLKEGLTPIFSNIERYSFFLENLLKVEKFMNEGVVMEISGEALMNNNLAKRMVEEGYVHIISSDHLLESLNTLDETTQEKLIMNMNFVFHNEKVMKMK